MRRRWATALGTLALGWLAGPALAADPAVPSIQIVAAADASKPATAPAVAPSTTPVVAPSIFCNQGGDSCNSSGHIVAGAGIYLLKEHPGFESAFERDVTSVTNRFGSSTTTTHTNSLTEFSHDYEAAPLIWLGYVSESGLGARVRWWRFESESSVAVTNGPLAAVVGGASGITQSEIFSEVGNLDSFVSEGNPNAGDNLFFHKKTDLTVYDFEVTQAFTWANWGLEAAAGVRYAMLHQNYDAHRRGLDVGTVVPPDGVSGTILTDQTDVIGNHNFNGVGPTIALEVRRPLGDTGLALFANVRGAVLFGQDKTNSTTKDVFITDSPSDEEIVTVFSASHDRVVPVAELELGGEYSKDMGGIRPFVRAGVVSQTWFGVGSATATNQNLGFFGFMFTGGFTY